MEPIRHEIRSFVDGCVHLMSLNSGQGLSDQESDLIDHYLLEVENFVCGDEPELGMRGTDSA